MAAEPQQPASHLSVVEPAEEPIVVTVGGRSVVVQHDDPAWPIAWALRETETSLKLAEQDLRSKRALIKRLREDADKDRKTCPEREVIERLFTHWQERCNHKRSKLTAERFDAARAMIGKDYTEVEMMMAIEGAAFDPFIRPRKNGTMQRFDEFELIFRDGKHLEAFACKAPITQPQETTT